MKYLMVLMLLVVAPMSAYAQPLADIAPPATVLSLGLESGGEFYANDLLSDIASLDWDAAGVTLMELFAYIESSDPGGEFDDFNEGMGELGAIIDEAVAACPGIADFLDEGLPLVGDASLLTVSISPFGAMPAVTAMSRFSGEQAGRAAALQETLVDCAQAELGELPTLQEGDTTLFVLADGSDLPLIVGSTGDVFIIGTEPETTRGVVRRIGGADEASFADSRVAQLVADNFDTGGLSYTVDLQALADVAENFAGMASQPEEQLAAERAIALLRTLGGIAGNVRTTDVGLQAEAVVAVDPEGGDLDLADILLCEECVVSPPDIVPASSISYSSQYNFLPDFFDYTQIWVDAFEPYIGTFDIAAFVEGEFGINLDTALFDWMGDSIHTAMLEPYSSDLETLLYNPPVVTLIPVSSPEAADAGLEELAEVLPLIEMLLGEFPDDDMQVFADILDSAAFDTLEYEGYTIDRYRYSLNTNIGLTYVDDYMVIASPAEAAFEVIDTFNGDIDDIFQNPDYRAVETAAGDSLQIAYADYATQLEESAHLLSLFSQPLAFLLSTGLEFALMEQEAPSMGMGMGNFDSFSELTTDLSTVMPDALLVPSTVSGSIAADMSSSFNMGGFDSFSTLEELPAAPTETVSLGASVMDNLALGESNYFVLDAPADSSVTVTVNSNAFDTYLYVIDADAETYVFENDDNPDTSTSQLEFTPEAGTTYWVEVSSFGDFGEGEYTLSVTTTEDASEADAPSQAYYALEGINPGDEVTVTLSSDEFDTYLYIIDASSETYLFENDDNPDTSTSEIVFTAEEGVTYWVEVASFGGFGGGTYELSVMTDAMGDMAQEPMTEDMPEAPSFADLLHLIDMGPEILYIIADYVGYAESYSEVIPGEGIYVYKLLNIDW